MSKRKRGNKWGTIGGIGLLLASFGGKLKFLIPLLKLGKIGGMIWSMMLTIGLYALIYPWTFAIGLVLMLLIHEMGHLIAARQKGLPVSAPAFIPFLGALVTMKKMPSDAKTEAYIAIAGPILGSAGALVALLSGMATGYKPLFAIAQVGFFLNLINLLPIHPLDGGRIVTAISRWLWWVGLIVGLVIILYLKAIVFLFIWALFAWELYSAYFRKKPKLGQAETSSVIKVDRSLFEETGLLPQESHRRELPFVQFCRLEGQQEICAVSYPGVGPIGEFEFPVGLIQKVELAKTTWLETQGVMRLRVQYAPYPEYRSALIREDAYYKVTPVTRIGYGIAYFGLAGLLGWLMRFTAVAVTAAPPVG
ncbi:site-2 protease family protein [Effusibacillus dendaii]|uniref:Site-2 protease family protein n=1 Tax=Effusibacillus dendaii TaxID=2743772 RepID=A0A7I8DEE7_9BACL|nr:site-2 protease family protein [Effusibacillus dendaii]BCJ88417.1 site-2 protease family protein [Effusibacillus dendaii]